MITERETELQHKINEIQMACREAHEELEVLLQPLREPIGEYSRELKVLQAERFEQETGLKLGDELYPTPRFAELQKSNGRWWETDNRPLIVGDTVFEYVLYNQIRVAQGAGSVGGIPVLMVMEMRYEWLRRHPEAVTNEMA